MGSLAQRTTILITGANQGIGLEVVKKLAREQPNFAILLGSRNAANGAKATASIVEFASNTTVSPIEIDINSDASITNAVSAVEKDYDHLDILLNNAAIWEVETPTRAEWSNTFNTNVTSQYFVTKAFEPLLRKSAFPRVVFVTSSLGSITLRLDPSNAFYDTLCGAYDVSKTALNMLAVQMSRVWMKEGWKVKVNLVNPGFRSTQLTRFTEYASKAEDGAVEICRVVTEGDEGKRDVMTSDGGEVVPW
jgi:NAD(P)-dependent dehydrogenase (short-subunit alcohol dehydrogenase family)